MENLKNEFTYYCRLRPPMPGCQPRKGLIKTSSDITTVNNREYWGTVTYDRELTKEELCGYDLDNIA